MDEEPTCYLSTVQAAALLGLSPRTLDCYRLKGTGPPFLTYCNRIHYLRADLDAWAVEGRRTSTSDDGGGRSARSDRGGRAGGRGTTRRAQRLEEAARSIALSGADAGHLSVEELAALLQVSRRTLDRYRANGKGPRFEKIDRRIVYSRSGVEAWLAGWRRTPVRNGAAGSVSDCDGRAGEAHAGAPESAR